MALGTISVDNDEGRSGGPYPMTLISFLGDGAYASGGTAAFQTSVRAALGANVEVLAVVGQDCDGYIPTYDKAADKLKVWEQTDTATAPLIETATADLSGSTFNILVISK